MVKDEIRKALEDCLGKTEIVIVPNKDEPFNLDKAMVWFMREPDPYEGLYIKLRIVELPDKAVKWLEQEMEMVRYRVRIHMGKSLPPESGNPMTAKQAIQHLHWVKRYIREHLELYR
jgi:hypothetical protein